MDNKYLQEYEAKEIEAANRFISRKIENAINSDEIYPSRNRFPNLHDTYSYAIQKWGATIWPQVPITGSLIITLCAVKENSFEERHRFSVSEIPEVINFAQETGRIQFVLNDRPTNYVGLDYLQPFFNELQPPFKPRLLEGSGERENIFKMAYLEYETVGKLGYFKAPPEFIEKVGGKMWESEISGHGRVFASLRVLGFNDVADIIIDNLLIDPIYSLDILTTFDDLILHPAMDTLHAIHTYDLVQLEKSPLVGDFAGEKYTNKKRFPYEVGSFLMKKLTYYPESLQACKEVIAHYEDNDVYKVYDALTTAIHKSDIDSVLNGKQELNEILDNVWAESGKLKRRAVKTEIGLDWLIGTVGFAIDGVPGLLTTVGFTLLDRTASKFTEQFGELISKKIANPYAVTIFDFQKKYKIEK